MSGTVSAKSLIGELKRKRPISPLSGKPRALNHELGIAIAMRTYKAARDLLSSPRWHRIYNTGAYPQRLLWASTGTKDPTASDILYVKALAAPFTVNTMPEATLKALANHKELGSILPADGGDCEGVLSRFADAGINVDTLAAQLQEKGARAFVESSDELMSQISSKAAVLRKAAGWFKGWETNYGQRKGDGNGSGCTTNQRFGYRAAPEREAWTDLEIHYRKVRGVGTAHHSRPRE